MVGPMEATFAFLSILVTLVFALGGLILFVIVIVALWRMMKAQEASVALLREIADRMPGDPETRKP